MRQLFEILLEVAKYNYSSLADEVGLSDEVKDRFIRFMKVRFPNKEGTDWGYHETWAQRFKRGEEWEFSDSESRVALQVVDANYYANKK
jgi:hypothetical protein